MIEYRDSHGNALEVAASGRVTVAETSDIRKNLESRGCPAHLVERAVARAAAGNRSRQPMTDAERLARAEQLGEVIRQESASSREQFRRECAAGLGVLLSE